MTAGEAIGRMVPALLVVLALPLGVYWWARRGDLGGRSSSLRVGAKASLGKSLWVAVVEVDGRRFLVGVADHGINLVAELDPVDDPNGSDTDADPDTPNPRMGLVKRLQHLTVRRPVRDPWRPRVPAA